MHIGNSFHGVQPVKLIISPTKTLRKRIVSRVVLVLQLKLLWPTASIIHVIRTVNCRTHIYPVLRVLVTATVLHVELRLLLVLAVLWVRVHPLTLKFLLDYLALYETFGFLEIVHGPYDLWVGGNDIGTDVGVLCPDAILDPHWAVLVVGSLVQVVSGARRKNTWLCIIHCYYVNFIIRRIAFY